MSKYLKILLLCTIATLAPKAANAGPVLPFLQAAGAWLTATFGATIGAAIAQIGISLIVSTALSYAMGRRGASQQDLIRELQQPKSLPVKRFVYGNCMAPGTPAPVRVKNDIIYACYILNSRESAGPFILYLDKREVEYTGNPYDFSGNGAISSNAPFTWGTLHENHCRYWIGRGDQVGPPQVFLDEAPELFTETDAWRGLTIIWLRLRAGGNETRGERWPATPPEVLVAGRWSLLRDPRAPDEPASYSANQALCVLDALRENPIRPYDDRNLWMETFEWAANVADENFPVKGGAFIPRFEVNGVLAFTEGVELEDQIVPLYEAGASDPVRVGGRLGILPAVYSEPVMTFNGVLNDSPVVFTRYRPSGELLTHVYANYTSPERMYEDATTPEYSIFNALEEDNGAKKTGNYNLRLVIDYRQAQYVAAILGRKTRMQKSFSSSQPAKVFNLIAGSVVMLNLPTPYLNRNGIYRIEEMHPGGDPVGLNGLAMRCQVSMREISPAIYAWNPAIDEQDISFEAFDPNIGSVQVPGDVTAISDASTILVSGDSLIARILFFFAPSASSGAIGYEWQFRIGAGLWQTGGSIDRIILNSMGNNFGYLTPAIIGQSYVIRVRTVSIGGASDWVESNAITASAGSYLAPPPNGISAIGGSGEIAVTFQAPNNPDYRALEVWASTIDDSGASALLFGPVYGSPNSVVTEVETGLGSAVTRYYFARSLDRNGSYSPFSPSINATTT